MKSKSDIIILNSTYNAKLRFTQNGTGKKRVLRLNCQLHIKECYEQIQPIGIKAPILVSQKGIVLPFKQLTGY